MSKVKDLAYDIEQLFIDGLSAKSIATELDCPVEVVNQFLADFGVSAEEEEYSPYNGA
jgi:hypothetical protein